MAKCTPLAGAAINRKITRLSRAGRNDDGVEVLTQQLRLDVVTDVGVTDELDAFLFHQLQTTLDDFFLVELHVRNAVHQQTARTIGTLEHSHVVTGFVQLSSSGEAGRAGADDSNALTGASLRRLGQHPAFFPTAIDDRVLDRLDRDGRIVDAEHARTFARRRARDR